MEKMKVKAKGKKKELKRYKNILTTYLTQQWERGHIPSLKQVISSLNLINKPLLIEILRQLRYARILDGSYDLHGVYRLYPFKKYAHLNSELILTTHYKTSHQ